MNEVIRYSSFVCLIILNQILLATNLWPISPDLFLVHTLIYTTFVKKIPNIYLFIFMGFFAAFPSITRNSSRPVDLGGGAKGSTTYDAK